MAAQDVLAVVGVCAPERASYARRLASAAGRHLLSERALSATLDPLGAAARLAEASAAPDVCVVEFPLEAESAAVIGALTADPDSLRLRDLVCVVDAAHFRMDLRSEDFLWTGDASGISYTARALVMVQQIEFASTIVLVGADAVGASELATLSALMSHLNPRARILLDVEDALLPEPGRPLHAEQDSAGWLALLNREFTPAMTDRRVSALCWESMRPLHPGRLHGLLTGEWAGGALGDIVRSAGLCRLATRPGITGAWEQAGQTFSLDPLARDDDRNDEPLAFGQSIAVIGIDLRPRALLAALETVVLTEEELLAGPESWRSFPDPFPAWTSDAERAG